MIYSKKKRNKLVNIPQYLIPLILGLVSFAGNHSLFAQKQGEEQLLDWTRNSTYLGVDTMETLYIQPKNRNQLLVKKQGDGVVFNFLNNNKNTFFGNKAGLATRVQRLDTINLGDSNTFWGHFAGANNT